VCLIPLNSQPCSSVCIRSLRIRPVYKQQRLELKQTVKMLLVVELNPG
jgi:hypothetical protein